MRLNQGITAEERESLKLFADWVLKIENGKVSPPVEDLSSYEEDDIVILNDFCDTALENNVVNMINWTYPNFTENFKCPKYLSERAILTPTNHTISHLNSAIVDTILGEVHTYYSVDKAEDFGGTASDLDFAFPPEYLHSFNIPGLPPHELKLKVGVVVMLMRNLNQTLGLCN
ncbi:uncharacterized protein LOC108221513 [Daucus carota subsp. sativus]|uniref:uncharacterized protein LOC108221513 n=1 Tax=Daucus carota subsp. sativus TaxID=79200 RepID=UPI0007EFFA50|nr:PREDICTED: uncharacterized protein LOC108221513 [Daucus carota subsp. sativus]